MSLRPLVVAMLAGSALAAGCGESGSEGSKERFIADGDKLCANLAKRARVLLDNPVSSTPEETLASVSVLRELARDLSAVLAKDPPSGDEDATQLVSDAKRLASLARAQKVVAKEILAAIEAGDVARVQRLGSAFDRVAQGRQTKLANQLDARMRAYGFKNCGRSN